MSYNAFVGIVLLCHQTVVVLDVLERLTGEPAETNQAILSWLKP